MCTGACERLSVQLKCIDPLGGYCKFFGMSPVQVAAIVEVHRPVGRVLQDFPGLIQRQDHEDVEVHRPVGRVLQACSRMVFTARVMS